MYDKAYETPGREALIRLENDNLVNIYPRKGIFVSNITPKLIKDPFQIGLIVEPQVLKIIGPNINKEKIIDALINEDYDKAVRALINHIKNSEEVAFKYIMI